jgi:hypothetical protein
MPCRADLRDLLVGSLQAHLYIPEAGFWTALEHKATWATKMAVRAVQKSLPLSLV